jgi:integrase
LLGQVDKGEDPQEDRVERRTGVTIADLCDTYLAAVKRGAVRTKFGRPKTPRTIETDVSRINSHIKPILGKKRVADLTKQDVAEFIAKVESGGTAKNPKAEAIAAGLEWKPEKLRGRTIVTGGPGAAARTTGLLSGIFTYAVECGMRSDNPVHGSKRPKDRKRYVFLSPVELGRLGRQLSQAETKGFNPTFVAAIRFCALTGCRLGEVQALRWSELDRANGILRFGSTKTGQSFRPVSSFAIGILPNPIEDCEWVFPSETSKAGHIIGMTRAFRDIATAADIELDGVALHIFRHTFSTVAAELSYVEVTRAAMLGQASHGTNAQYTHVVDHVLIAAAERVAGHIAHSMNLQSHGSEGQTEGVEDLVGLS